MVDFVDTSAAIFEFRAKDALIRAEQVFQTAIAAANSQFQNGTSDYATAVAAAHTTRATTQAQIYVDLGKAKSHGKIK